jgi:heme b synthase
VQPPQRHPLRLVFWETTARCNLYCIHCRAATSPEPRPGELNTREALRFVRSLASFARPILVLSGGEPLYRADLFEIAAEAARLGLRTALATNGTLVDEAVAAKVRAAGIVRAAVSLDGPDAAIHDAFRGLAGSFDAAVAGLKRLKAAGVETQINTTVTRHNADALPRTLELALDLGVKALHVFMLVPVGCGAEISDEQMLPPERYEAVLEWLFAASSRMRMRARVPIELKATCAPHYFRIMRQRAKEAGIEVPRGDGLSAVTKGCLAGQSVCFISHTGEVYPCGYLPISSGNIRTTPLDQIWDTSEIFARLRDPDLLEGKCGVCGFRTVCGGCRARAYAATGNELAEEPFCLYQPPGQRT